MDTSRFTAEDWQTISERLEAEEGGFDKQAFVAWLVSPGTFETLDKRLGEDWTLAEALTVATGGPAAMRRKGRKSLAAAIDGKVEDRPLPAPDPTQFEARYRARLDIYIATFEGVTPNDKASLEAMVNSELMLEHLRNLQQAEVLSVKPDGVRIERIAKTLKIYEELHQTLQKQLGIDRATREKRAKAESAEDQVWAELKAGAEFVEQEVLKVVHDCGVECGLLLMTFREFPYKVQAYCPACKESFWNEHVPTEEDKQAANEPAFVADEEDKYRPYTTAPVQVLDGDVF